MKTYPDDLTDEQREILGREMPPEKIDGWVKSVFKFAEERKGKEGYPSADEWDGQKHVDSKITIIEASQPPNPYDEMRRRAYPNIGDQLDDLYHKGAFSDEMAAKLKAVKDTNPKE